MISVRASRRVIRTLVCSFMSKQESKQDECADAEQNHKYERRAFHSGKKEVTRIGSRDSAAWKLRDDSIREKIQSLSRLYFFKTSRT